MKRFSFLITITFVCCFYSCNSSTKESETKKTIVVHVKKNVLFSNFLNLFS